MELPEIEQLVGEVENRVERLRSLYDQYFMGIERIEPQIARKDVERRIQQLRKTQIRNTAIRFRFQNALLRYNTFSAHWIRICRQIEEGTYKHHLRKAKERFAGPGADKKTRDAQTGDDAFLAGDTERPPAGPPVFELDEGVDVDVNVDEGLAAADVRTALRSYAIPRDAVAPSAGGRAMAAMTGNPLSAKNATGSAPGLGDRPDRNTDLAPPPVHMLTAPPKPPPIPGRSAAPPPLPPRAGAAAGPARPPVPTGTASAPPARPAPPLATAPGAGKSIPPPLPPRAAAAIPSANVRIAVAPAASSAPSAPPAPATSSRPAPAPAASNTQPAPPPGTVSARPPRVIRPIGAPAPGAQPIPSTRPAEAKPVDTKPAPAPAAARTASTPPKPTAATSTPPKPTAATSTPPKPAAAASTTDERDRQLYSKYVEARRSNGESTATITMDGLAKTLRDSREKVRQKHPGRTVDFEVQVKDGKTVLKPVVK